MASIVDNYIPAFRSAIARIFHPNGAVVGVGFLVSGRSQNYILTCAHVVTSALFLPQDIVEIPINHIYFDFPLIASGQKLKAKVVFWQPVVNNVSSSEPEDIAGLQIEGQLPHEAQPIKLISASNIWGHPFRIFGFPHGHNDGVWSTGVLRDGQGKGWVQLEDSKVTGYRVEPGFSGAPIWDETLAGVVGMAVAAEKQRQDIKTAFMIPADVLSKAWDEITLPISSNAHTQNSPSRVQQIKINSSDFRKNYLEHSIARLKTEIESLGNQIGWTLNDVDKNKLQRQLDDKFGEIEKAESELNQLNQQPRQVQQLKINSSDFRKNYLEQLIARLKTEIESLGNQIGWTLNDVDKNKLQRQLDDRFDEIEKAESELKQLNQQPRQVQ